MLIYKTNIYQNQVNPIPNDQHHWEYFTVALLLRQVAFKIAQHNAFKIKKTLEIKEKTVWTI